MTVLDKLKAALKGDDFWDAYLTKCVVGDPSVGVHLAVFQQPFLGWILDGTKTVESRFSSRELAPFQSVSRGDVLLLKLTGGPVIGVALATAAWSYRLDSKTWAFIRAEFSESIGAVGPEFWKAREHCRYATLISIDHSRRVRPIEIAKRDRRGWVVLSSETGQLELDL